MTVAFCKTSLDVRDFGLEFWVAFPWHETSSFSAIAEAWYKTAAKGLGGPLSGFDTLMTVLVNGKPFAFV